MERGRLTAMGLFGRITLRGAWVGAVHRWSGRAAVLISVPVAVHCLYALGFQAFDGRVITHSLFGCFLYGAFVFKMLILTQRWYSCSYDHDQCPDPYMEHP